MRDLITKTEAKKRIEQYFSKNDLNPKETKKIKKLAMQYRIRLREERKRFCRKCFRDLMDGKVKISKTQKTVICKCGFVNKWKI
jgi:RNase P subunit RPR2